MGLLGMVARTAVVAGTASAVGGRVQRRQQRKWGEADAQEAEPVDEEPQQQVPEQRSAPPAPDRLEQLTQLGQLKDSGVLTEAEFAAEKAKILAG